MVAVPHQHLMRIYLCGVQQVGAFKGVGNCILHAQHFLDHDSMACFAPWSIECGPVERKGL